jgi:uncharacterized membrane protein
MGSQIMFKRIATVMTAASAVIVFAHAPAKADFTVCNHTTYGPLMVAAAYEYDSGSDSWSRSEGFYNIPQGDCVVTLNGLTGDEELYLFAWATNDQSVYWDGTANYSSNAKQFCVDGYSSGFMYRADDAQPPCSKGVVRTFRYAGTADSTGDFTYNLTD